MAEVGKGQPRTCLARLKGFVMCRRPLAATTPCVVCKRGVEIRGCDKHPLCDECIATFAFAAAAGACPICLFEASKPKRRGSMQNKEEG